MEKYKGYDIGRAKKENAKTATFGLRVFKLYSTLGKELLLIYWKGSI
jgi:hypothetical protein